jgi:NTE family protein
MSGYLDVKERPYVHLLDGGIADNLGLRVPIDNVVLVGGPTTRLQQVGAKVDEVAVIVVNAEVHPPARFELAATAPGLAAVLGAVSDTQIYSYNFETLDLMRTSLKAWARTLDTQRGGGRPVHTHLIEVGFEMIEDPKQREYFEEVPTSFTLSDERVDRLIAVARQLLRESPEYRELVADLTSRSWR